MSYDVERSSVAKSLLKMKMLVIVGALMVPFDAEGMLRAMLHRGYGGSQRARSVLVVQAEWWRH